MNIAIKGVGICTARIHNVDDLCDQLLKVGKSYKTGEENIIDTLQNAVREADAIDLPIIQVNSKEESGRGLYKAFCEAETMPEAAIICSQENEYGYDDTAVIVTSNEVEEEAWAVITGITGEEGGPSMEAKLYRTRGPVQEACAVITECASLRYGIQFPSKVEEEMYLTISNKASREHKVSIHGGQVMVKEAKVVDESSTQITKHLVPLAFETRDEILEKLSQLVQLVHRLSLEEISKNVRKGFFEKNSRGRTVVFAAKSSEELLQEIEGFLQVQSSWEQEGYVWKTDIGSFYTATPLQEGDKICLVNPPANMFSKLQFYRLYRALPSIKKQMEDIFSEVEGKHPLIKWYAFESWSRRFARKVLNTFGISSNQAVGMGLGELSLPYVLEYAALDEERIEHKDTVACMMQESISLLEELLLSRPQLVKRYLKNMPEGAMENWYVMCDAGTAKMAVAQMKERIRNVKESLSYEVYSTSLQKRLEEGSTLVSEALVGSITRQVDIALIIRQIYKQGGRVFLTLGSGGLCNQWIRESLQDKQDVLVTSLFEQQEPADSLPYLLAQCMSYGVQIDYGKFYDALSWQKEQETEEELRAKLMEHLLKCNYRLYRYNKSDAKKQIPEKEGCHVAELSSMQCNTQMKYLYGIEEILEMTKGSMANILGQRYQEVDRYEVRERMPMPPFLFVSCITKIAAEYRKFEAGSYIEGEFTVTKDTILLMNHKFVSNLILLEAGHIGRFLFSYMGMDAASYGTARYEVSEIIEEHYGEEWPEVGDVLGLCYVIDRFEKTGEGMRLYSTYDVSLKGKSLMQLKIVGSCANSKHLDIRRGIGEKQRSEVMFRNRCPIYHPLTGRHQFSKEQMKSFLYGNVSSCFGGTVECTPLVYWSEEEGLLIDRILDISSEGGGFGYGYLLSEKKIDEEFWPFSVHFKNNPVLPQSMMLEMITQTVLFFACYMGIHDPRIESVPRIVKNHPNRSRFGGEVTKGEHTIIVKVEPRKVEQVEEERVLIYDGAVYCDGILMVRQEGAALWIS